MVSNGETSGTPNEGTYVSRSVSQYGLRAVHEERVVTYSGSPKFTCRVTTGHVGTRCVLYVDCLRYPVEIEDLYSAVRVSRYDVLLSCVTVDGVDECRGTQSVRRQVADMFSTTSLVEPMDSREVSVGYALCCRGDP